MKLFVQTFSTIIVFLFWMSLQAQPSDFYQFEEAFKHPKTVKTLTLNLNFHPVDSIPEQIGTLENLEEIVFFPCFLGRVGGGMIRYPTNINKKFSVFMLPDWQEKPLHLPESIGHLHQLKRIVLSNNYVQELPATIVHLKELQELNLDFTSIHFDKEFDKLIALPSLKMLSIYRCQASEEKVEEFRRLRPEVSLIFNAQDAERYSATIEPKEGEVLVELQFHDTYVILYKEDKDGERYFATLPADMRKQIEKADKKLERRKKKEERRINNPNNTYFGRLVLYQNNY